MHFQDFRAALANYQASDEAKQVISKLKLVLLVAPTSAGKNTIIRHQLATGRYYHIVSDTTRAPRLNDGVIEKDGVDYWFRSEEEMLADIQKGRFLEAEVLHNQQVSGMSIRELEHAQQENKIAINDVEIEGIHNVLKLKPDTIAVMLLPPSFEEWQNRLASRGPMPAAERQRRLKSALKIFQDGQAHPYYQFVISDDIEQSGNIIDGIVNGQPNPHQAHGRLLIGQLQSALEASLLDHK